MKNTSINKQSGAVSLFVVIFFMLLVTVITVSFVRLMVADQRQASDNDLSQSAYDSAQAGVEDAKRALLKYQQGCATSSVAICGIEAAKLASLECNAGLNDILGLNILDSTNGKVPEVKVQQTQTSGDADAALDQAYTCVTVKLQTDDYIGSLTANQSRMVPLKGVSDFDRVKLQWFSREDITSASAAVSLTGVSATGQPLYSQGTWPINRPSLMRAQLMQFSGNFTLNSFDTVSGAQSNAATMFLYPTSQSGIVSRDFATYDQRRANTAVDPLPKDSATTPLPVSCVAALSAGGFACTVDLVLPQAINAATATNRTEAFLRLQALYNATHFRASLWNGAVAVKFKDVQPEVDSTGRANDLFKRVASRVDLYDMTFPYPDAAVDVTGNFCKDFTVTDTQYSNGSSGCTP